MSLRTFSKIAVVVAILLGIGMIALGVIFVLMGYGAKSDIREALLKEKVITGADSAIPGVLVEDLVTAKAQQDTIEAHTFGRFGAVLRHGAGRPQPGRVHQGSDAEKRSEPGSGRIWRGRPCDRHRLGNRGAGADDRRASPYPSTCL